jgi:hypothetical protein
MIADSKKTAQLFEKARKNCLTKIAKTGDMNRGLHPVSPGHIT